MPAAQLLLSLAEDLEEQLLLGGEVPGDKTAVYPDGAPEGL